MELREQIINEALMLFNEKGIAFSMDEIASRLKISKKTIYKHFSCKNQLIIEIVKGYFSLIKKTEDEIYSCSTLTTFEKIERIFCLNAEHHPLNLTFIESLKDSFPDLYQEAQIHLKESWDKSFKLLEKGIEEGCIKKINIDVLKAMINGFFEHMFKEKLLDYISYHEAIEQISSIIINGIRN